MLHPSFQTHFMLVTVLLFSAGQTSDNYRYSVPEKNKSGAAITPVNQSSKAPKDIYSKDYITSRMHKVADWQLANPVSFNSKNENDWARAAFYTGVMAAYRTTQDQKYLTAAMDWSQSFNWMLAKRLRHADDHAKGQTYLEIYELKKDPKMIADIKSTYDSLIADPKPGRVD